MRRSQKPPDGIRNFLTKTNMGALTHTPYSRGILILLCILIGVQIFYSVVYMPTWLDETEYIYSGWLILHENLMPYRDLFFRAPPFVYYIYGIPQYLLGTGLTLGRIESSLFVIGSLILLYYLAKKLGGNAWAGIMALALIGTNPYSIIHFATATPYSIIGFLFVAGLAFFFSSRNHPWRLIGAGLCIGATALIRQNVIFAVFWYVLILLLQNRPWRERIWGSIAALFPVALGYGIFFQLAGDQMLKAFFMIPYPEDLGAHFYLTFTKQNVLSRFIVSGKSFAIHFLVYMLLIVCAVLLIQYARKNFIKPWKQTVRIFLDEQGDVVLIGGLFFAIFAPHFLLFFIIPFSSGTIYALYSFHLAVLFVAIALFRFLPDLQNGVSFSFPVLLLTAGLILTPFAGGAIIDLPLVHPFKENDTGRLTRAAKTIQEVVPPGSTVFTVDGPFFLLYPELRLISPALLYRDSLWTKNTDNALVQKYGFFNYTLIDQWLKEADFYFEQEDARMENFRKTVHAVPFEANTIIGDIITKNLAERYELVARVDNSYPGRYKYTGNLLIYKRVK
jgi:4-amino-4-deoxy-L-arabinose transferase-like glycosyltransferase